MKDKTANIILAVATLALLAAVTAAAIVHVGLVRAEREMNAAEAAYIAHNGGRA